MTQNVIYIWVNEKNKIWTVTNDEDELLIGMTDESYIKEFRLKSTRERLDYELKLSHTGFLYCDYNMFLI